MLWLVCIVHWSQWNQSTVIYSIIICHCIWAATWQNQQNECAASEDSDQPGHLPSLIRVFAVHSMGSYGPKVSSCGQQRLWSVWADAQPFCWLCHVADHFFVLLKDVRWLQFWFFNFRFLSCWITLKQWQVFSYFFHIWIHIDGILQPSHKIYQSMKLHFFTPFFAAFAKILVVSKI